MSYKKREKEGWNCGKRCKGTRKAYEREFTTKEIEEQIASLDPNFRYRHKARHPNRVAKLEHQIAWYERTIAEGERDKQSWRCLFVSYARDSLKKAQKKLEELKNAVRS